jgi:hypothetical protein
MPLPLGEGSLNWCAAQDSNLHFPAFKAGPLPIGLRGQRMVRQARLELALLSF